jgi:ribosomal-protein-alanine N-acetyltransferase
MSPVTDDLVVRPMTLDDVAPVAAIERRSFPLPWSENSFRSDLTSNPASHLLVAEQGDGAARRIAGYAGYWLIIDEAHLGTIAVDPGLRRRGIGERMLREAMEHAARQGADMMTLEVRASNEPAQRLYEKAGFRVVGRRPHYYKDNFEDAILMTLERLTEVVRANGRGHDR